ncbi:helix-turn-helix domain-containing protein [Agrobacterium pusense]|uniref:helix-turn-helix domain-containing protein n=1 Tax=Agrobacterium pusense TaxID=648995 RepID=UPI003FD2DAEB
MNNELAYPEIVARFSDLWRSIRHEGTRERSDQEQQDLINQIRNALDRKLPDMSGEKPDWIADSFAVNFTAYQSETTLLLQLRHRDLGSLHALKTVPPPRRDDTVSLQRLRDEAEIGLALRHPCLVETSALLRLPDGRPGLLQPWVSHSLASIISAQPIAASQAMVILRDRAPRVRRMASVCSGAFLLAEAGLLDSRRAVTHWGRCDEFTKRFPKVRLERDPIFLRDGSIWTSAGVTAGIDLALAMVEEDHGRALALTVARELVVFLKRPGGQSQFSVPLGLQTVDDRFMELHAWIATNIARPITLDILADQAGMSRRSFVRHYRQRTGRTPAEGVEMIRLERAQGLLETGSSVETTARKCGFGSPETMRRLFLRRLGVGPKEWQERFRG